VVHNKGFEIEKVESSRWEFIKRVFKLLNWGFLFFFLFLGFFLLLRLFLLLGFLFFLGFLLLLWFFFLFGFFLFFLLLDLGGFFEQRFPFSCAEIRFTEVFSEFSDCIKVFEPGLNVWNLLSGIFIPDQREDFLKGNCSG
jgi:hypothetical protein